MKWLANVWRNTWVNWPLGNSMPARSIAFLNACSWLPLNILLLSVGISFVIGTVRLRLPFVFV